MAPELKFHFVLPGFGSLELLGEYDGTGKSLQEVSIKFIPLNTGSRNRGVLVKLCRNGDCDVHELKTLKEEVVFEGSGIS